MFYKVKLKDYVDLSPELFDGDLNESVKEQLTRNYQDKTTEDLGLVVTVSSVDRVGEGFKLPEDASSSPLKIFINVDLPQPFAPIKP